MNGSGFYIVTVKHSIERRGEANWMKLSSDFEQESNPCPRDQWPIYHAAKVYQSII
jgi:hypothetical protein